MTKSTPTRQLLRKGRSLLSRRLPQWTKYRGHGLYRRTEDFVQWLVLDPSSYKTAFRVHYAVQALAERFPVESLTLGDFVRSDLGIELSFLSESLLKNPDEFVEYTINQVSPTATVPFSARSVDDFLEERKTKHVSALVAQGIAKIAQGDIQLGRTFLCEAVDWYNCIDTPWAKSNLDRIQAWLMANDLVILERLRSDAYVGASLLHLK
jgi:hypothetical protein